MSLFFLFFATIAWATNPVIIQIPSEPDTLDPMQVSDVIGYSISSNLYEGLVRLDGKGVLRKGLAESYEISKNGKEYRFKIRKNAKWSDGKPVLPEHFIFAFERALSAKNAARDANYLRSIRGADERLSGDQNNLGIRSVKNELIIDLKYPDATFLQALAMPMSAPQRRDFPGIQNGDWNEKNPTTGPYVLTQHQLSVGMRLEPNVNYMGVREPILYKIIPEETTALNLFETGKIDILSSVPPTEIARLRRSDQIIESPGAATFFLRLRADREPFSNLEWRRALSVAVDRVALAKILPGSFLPTNSYIPKAIDGYTMFPEKKWQKSVQKIFALDKPPLTISYAGSELSNLIMQRVQNDFQKNLNWEVKLEPLEWKTFLSRLQVDAPAIYFSGYSAAFNDPISHLKIFLSTESDNHTHFSHKGYDQLVTQIKRKASGAARTKLVKKAQKILLEDEVVVIPLLERRQVTAVSKRISGFLLNPYGMLSLRDLKLKK